MRPFGERLPNNGNPEQLRRVFETRQPAISDVFRGGVTGSSPKITVDVPVLANGRVAYVLSVGIISQQMNQILLNQHLPPDWVAGVFDRRGSIVARTHASEQFVGQKGAPEFVQRMLAVPEGALEATTREGFPSIAIYSRSPLSHWSVAIAIPRHSLEAQLMRTSSLVGLGVAILLSIGVGLAWFMGGRIARSVHALMAPAIALESGEALAIS